MVLSSTDLSKVSLKAVKCFTFFQHKYISLRSQFHIWMCLCFLTSKLGSELQGLTHAWVLAVTSIYWAFFYVPGTALSVLHELIHLVLPTALLNSTVRVLTSQVRKLPRGHRVRCLPGWWGWAFKPGDLARQSSHLSTNSAASLGTPHSEPCI